MIDLVVQDHYSWGKCKYFFAIFLCVLGSFFVFYFDAKASQKKTLPPTIHLSLSISEEKSNLKISGTVQIKDWSARERCLYLPFNDSSYGENRALTRRFEIFNKDASTEIYKPGQTSLSMQSTNFKVEELTPYLFKVIPIRGFKEIDNLNLTFSSTPPRLPNSDDTDWFFDGFYPLPLSECPTEFSDAYFRAIPFVEGTAQISVPEGWDIAGPLQTVKTGLSYSGNFSTNPFVFALSKRYFSYHFVADGTPVTLFYKTSSSLEIVSTIKAALSFNKHLLGEFPFPSLTVIETSELQKSNLPGVVTFNLPKQQLFHLLQTDWLNWRHWIIFSLVVSQWYGAAIKPSSLNDLWLMSGLVEFITSEGLQAFPERYNLVNTFDSGFRLFSFNYLQMQNLTAALLGKQTPFNVLTDESFVTKIPYALQDPLLFEKHALALRQIKNRLGEKPFGGFLKNFTEEYLFKRISPREFYQFIDRLPSPFSPAKRNELKNYLSQWWTKKGFPDFALADFSAKSTDDGKWVVTVAAAQKGEIKVPILVKVIDEMKKEYFVYAEKSKNDDLWSGITVTKYRPESVYLDPDYHVFDSNRFDNSSKWPGIKFFPGSANTLSDSDYTFVWAPYAFRRPGENVSLGVQSVLFKYLQSSLFFRYETVPSTGQNAVSLNQTYQYLPYALSALFLASQDYNNDRMLEASLSRDPLFMGDPKVALSLKTRFRQTAGEPETAHETVGAGFAVSPSNKFLRGGYKLFGEFERAPSGLAKNFSYSRRFTTLETLFESPYNLDFGLRGFYGEITYLGTPPNSSFFDPENLREAKLRLDVKNISAVSKIATINSEIIGPFFLPLPGNTLMLGRQFKWRLVYDFGRSFDKELYYRDMGGGFNMPFGGEFIGMGPLALTKLSVLAIFYSAVGNEVSKKPSILFDLTGNL